MSKEESEDAPYRIDIDQQGCPTCHAGRTYTIVGPDGVTALGRSWDNMYEALEWADELNAAYNIGLAARKTGKEPTP